MKKIFICRLSFTIPLEFPDDWTDEQVEFFLTESSSCATNRLREIQEYIDKTNDGCACSIIEVEILHET